MDPSELERAGLYDPDAPDAADRLAVLEWLVEERGLDLEQLVDAQSRGIRLHSVAGHVVIRPGECYTLDEIAERAGSTPERIERMLRAAGFSPSDPDQRIFTDSDLAVVQTFEGGCALFGDEPALQFTRVMGTSLARIAEAAVSLFLVHIEEPIVAREEGGLALARANLEALQLLDIIPSVLDTLFRVHVEEAVRRSREARAVTGSYETERRAIGFVDLVGFTPLSQQLAPRELAAVIEDFEAKAHDVVAARDGRVVKLIGDEVMFATLTAEAACDIALTLAETFAVEGSVVTPRGGIAVGPVVTRGGDYYGEIVNLASRVAELAVPYEILVTIPVRDEPEAAGASFAFEPAGRRSLKGFADPVELLAVTRRAR